MYYNSIKHIRMNYTKGKLLINEFGNAFVNTSCGKTIYIKKCDINSAYHLEEVELEYWIDETTKLFYGRVINFSLIGREFIGIVHHHFMNSVCIQITELKKKQIYIDNLNVYLPKGQWVRVIITSVEEEKINGKLIQVIEENIDQIIEYKYNLFSQKHHDIHSNKNSKFDTNIRDLTNHIVFSIDPEGCMDCDDAFSVDCTLITEGIISVYVHISDVAMYVNPDSPQFEDYIKRGNTFYGVKMNWPMISENISNNICSILPNKVTNVVTIHYIYNQKTNTLDFKEWFFAIIESKFKYTYEEIDLKLDETINNCVGFHLTHPCKILYNISSSVIEKEIPDIAITYETPAHRLVRYWMIKTNQTMCSIINVIYRINPKPQTYRFDLLKKYIEWKGHTNRVDVNDRTSMINYINKNIKMNDALLEHIVKKILLKAFYGNNNEEHYGLGIKNYTHFTSPIRRTCDLICQCILRGYTFTEEQIERYLVYMNDAEAKQDSIEDFIEKYKIYTKYKNELLINENQSQIVYKSTILDVMPTGIKVFIKELKDTFIIHISKLSKSILYFNREEKVLSNQNENYKMFDSLLVRIKKMELDNIELEIDNDIKNNKTKKD